VKISYNAEPGSNKKTMAGNAFLFFIYLFISMAACAYAQAPRAGADALFPPPASFETINEQHMYDMLQQGINTHVIWSGSGRYKNICLTFDDGPNPTYTPLILQILKEKKVRATFFLIGQHAQQHPDLVKKIYESGHELGDHTFSHVELPKIQSNKIKQEVETTRRIVESAAGAKIFLFRPPWGVFDGRSLAEIAMRKFDTVLWSVDSRDWSRPGIAQIQATVLEKAGNGSIILFHDDHDQIVQALPDIISNLQERGYQFITVSEMMALSMYSATGRQ
jgi:peptidoglycan-N-acetylglucosamine deacetylase